MDRSIVLYNALFKKHYMAVYFYALKMIGHGDSGKGSDDLGNDIASECFIALYNNWERIEDEKHAKRFLFKCAHNKAVNILQAWRRDQDRKDIISSELVDYETPTYDFDMIETEIINFIYNSLEELPPVRRETVKLYLKGFNSHEIAKKLGCTEKTALNQKLTAIKFLREKVKLKFGI